jgi:hypothetical protein
MTMTDHPITEDVLARWEKAANQFVSCLPDQRVAALSWPGAALRLVAEVRRLQKAEQILRWLYWFTAGEEIFGDSNDSRGGDEAHARACEFFGWPTAFDVYFMHKPGPDGMTDKDYINKADEAVRLYYD